MVLVKLNPAEIQIVKFIGKSRQDSNDRNGVVDRRIDKNRSSYEIDIDGFGAEMACAKLLNLYPDFDIKPRSKSPDLIGKNGKKIDVKNSKKNWLIVRKNKKCGDSDYYVLMQGTLPNYYCVGWASSKEIIKEENLKDWGYGEGKEAYSLPSNKLHKITL